MTQEELKEAVKTAMRNKEADKLSVLRGILSATTNELVAKGKKPDDILGEEEITALIRRAAKQRKDSIEQFEKGGRADLAEHEKTELSILEAYLPAQMSEENILAAAKQKALELGVTDGSQANKLIGAVMKDLKGNADGTVVKRVVDGLFS